MIPLPEVVVNSELITNAIKRRIMKKLIVPALIVIAVYFIFLTGSSFKKDFDFNGNIYGHVKKMSGGEITNHFYTQNGEDFYAAKNFIQILEFSDNIQKSDWLNNLKPIYSQYKLMPVQNQQFELAGSIKKAGIFFKSYAAPINVKGKDHMAFYIIATNKEPNEESDSQKVDIINKLKSINFD